MIRLITQVLVGIMLLFGAMTLFPKAYLEYRMKRTRKSLMYALLGLASIYFSIVAFYFAYLYLAGY